MVLFVFFVSFPIYVMCVSVIICPISCKTGIRWKLTAVEEVCAGSLKAFPPYMVHECGPAGGVDLSCVWAAGGLVGEAQGGKQDAMGPFG